LLRARGIETQCYLITSAQGSNHSNGRQTFGHSMIIDPWGKIEGVLAKGAGIVMGNINRQVITKIRTQLPALQQAMIEQTHKGTGE
ncbi:MAG: hypothetical protein KBD37_09325, partial [Burkholderiales bacterium]|nr:hypothetical protein [Burkholderiales bacterium]